MSRGLLASLNGSLFDGWKRDGSSVKVIQPVRHSPAN